MHALISVAQQLTVIGQSLHQPGRLRDPGQRMKMQSVFPTANIRFHEALDRMEEDIKQAQDIMKRDLAYHRVMEKQKAEQALAPPKEIKQEAAVPKMEDVMMVDEPANAPPAPMQAAPSTRVMEPVKPKEEVTQSLPPPKPAPIAPMMVPSAPSAPPAPMTAAAQAPESAAPATTEQAAPAQEATADATDELFSEFFGDDNGDKVSAGGDAELDDALADFGDNNADVSSLLPGLSDFANIPDDSAMPDAPPTSAPDDTAPTDALPDFNFGDLSAPQADANAQQQPQPDMNAQPDFGDIDFGFDAGGGEGGQQGDNSFNDLFDMDSYDFRGGGGDNGQDINDWMKSL